MNRTMIQSTFFANGPRILYENGSEFHEDAWGGAHARFCDTNSLLHPHLTK